MTAARLLDIERRATNSPPQVSVIVLNHNGERIIGRCLDHLLAQSFDDFEIIVVDNDSTDGSLAVMERYLGTGRLSIVRARRNLGVAGGRNLGVLHAQGAIVAFIDNDGYATPGWLAAVVNTMRSDPRLGVVASVVFFDNRKIVLNGAGGTINRQGYGADICFGMPYEFARIPHRTLYAMGCGMVVRKEVLNRIGPLDEKLFNYYDDVELGIRARKCGFEIVVAPDAWVDHGLGYSDKIFNNKLFLSEKNRIRTVLKYYPLRRLPGWFIRDCALCISSDRERLVAILKGWAWNAIHLPSALGVRLRFALRRGQFWNLVDPSWGLFPPPGRPNNQINHPDPAKAGAVLHLDGKTDAHQLNFGWYNPEHDGTRPFRWSAAHASAIFRLRKPALNLSLTYTGTGAKRPARVLVRRLETQQQIAENLLPMEVGWRRQSFPLHLPAGNYELLLLAQEEHVDGWGRILGAAVSSIEFE